MRIGLNLVHALQEIGGGWNYIRAVIHALAQWADGIELVAFTNSESEQLVQDHASITLVRTGLHAASRGRRVLFEHLSLPRMVNDYRIDCMHHFAGTLPLTSRGAAVVTVYDLLVHHRPQAFGFVKRHYVKWFSKWAARRASILAAMSETTASDLKTVLGVPTDRIAVVPPPISESFRPVEPQAVSVFRRRLGLEEHFWLYVAHGYPHKNHEQLIKAIAKRGNAQRWPLVLRGERLEWVKDVAEDYGVSVRVLPRLDDEEMATLYSAATCMVFPSLFEGGGMPICEAMACGCPVIASDIPAVREFSDGGALLFDPKDVDGLAAALEQAEASEPLRHRLIALGLKSVERYRPPAVVRSCISAYRRAMRNSLSVRRTKNSDPELG